MAHLLDDERERGREREREREGEREGGRRRGGGEGKYSQLLGVIMFSFKIDYLFAFQMLSPFLVSPSATPHSPNPASLL